MSAPDLEQRVAALEKRVAEIGREEDGIYDVLAARQLQLYDDEDRLRVILHTYDLEGESFAEAQFRTAEGRPATSVGCGDTGAVILYGREGALVDLVADEDGASLLMQHPGRNKGVEIGVGGVASHIMLYDSQDRERVLLAAGGVEEDVGYIALADGDGEDALMFRTPAVGSRHGRAAVDVAGWPKWVLDTICLLLAATGQEDKP